MIPDVIAKVHLFNIPEYLLTYFASKIMDEYMVFMGWWRSRTGHKYARKIPAI
jgi:hypothetical protein